MTITLRVLILTLSLTVLSLTALYAQETENERTMPEINFSGYIKGDFFIDSRQNVTARENMVLLYPKAALPDENGSDINDVANFQFIPFASRLTAKLTGTRILNARVTGTLEAEFFGTIDLNANGLRLRHANVLMEWESGVSLLMGQAWHPMFITECYPTTASFNTGMPFNPFARNPQLGLYYRTENVQYSVSAMSQLDFKSAGPVGGSTEYLRNSGMPELAGKILYVSDNRQFSLGAAAAWKQLRPRLSGTGGMKVNEKVGSASLIGFSKFTSGLTTIKVAGIVGQDMFHLMMLGGYAVRADNSYTGEDLFDQQLEYTPTGTFSTWGEFIYGKKWELGVFGGFTRNLGAGDDVDMTRGEPVYYARGSDVNYIFRVSPRVSYNVNNIRIGTETEYTKAAYAETFDTAGKPQGNDPAGNMRILLFVFYYF